MLDLTSYDRAIARLEEALQYAHSDLAKRGPRLATHLRASVIQAFEFTYELAYKMLRRYLQATEYSPEVIDTASFNDVIRLGFEPELLRAQLAEWKGFRTDRAATSHTYDELKAEQVLQNVPAFLLDAHHLRNAIREWQEADAHAS